MKKTLCFALLTLTAAPAVASAETILTCRNKNPRVVGGGSIVVSRDTDGWNLARKPMNPSARSTLIAKFDPKNVIYYGGAILMNKNMGRSGYIAFHYRPKDRTAAEIFLLDDHRFMQGAGVTDNFTCRASRY